MSITREKFESLALEHLDMLYRLARRWTGNPTQAEDLVQETYLRALRGYKDFKLETYGIRPWLVRIMHNLHVTQAQHERRQPMAMEEAALDGAGQELPHSNMPGPINLEAMDQHLVRSLEELPQEYQSVLLLWAVEEFSYKEIAQALDVPVGTVMSRLHRARAKLSVRLEDLAREQRIIRE